MIKITLDICMYVHTEIHTHSSQVQDFLCILWYSWPQWCQVTLNSHPDCTWIGKHSFNWFCTWHFLLHWPSLPLFIPHRSKQLIPYLRGPWAGKLLSLYQLAVLRNGCQRREWFDARSCTSFRVWTQDTGSACPDEDDGFDLIPVTSAEHVLYRRGTWRQLERRF